MRHHRCLIFPGAVMFDRLRLCFVSHRASPYPGGTEVFVHAMATAARDRGHDVRILTGQHKGDCDGIPVTSDQTLLDHDRFDLIVVHGATDGPPRRTLDRAMHLPSPVLYMVVAHCASHVRRHHLTGARLLGWSTPLDQRIIAAHGLLARAVRVRHGLKIAACIGHPGFRARHGIDPDRTLFLSCGGYRPNKRMSALAELFERTASGAMLVTTGYDNPINAMPACSARVLPLLLDDRAEVLSAIAEADCYLMHSRDEGFGLVLLEAMANRTPWIARATGGATVLSDCGQNYTRDIDLPGLIDAFAPDPDRIARAFDRVTREFDISCTIEDLEHAALQARLAAMPAKRGALAARLLLLTGVG